jgi:hypothetical protein
MPAMKVLGFFLGQKLVELETLFSGLKTLQTHKKTYRTMVAGM